MPATFSRVLLYVRDVENIALFYSTHFDFRIFKFDMDRIVELRKEGGMTIILHSAAKSQKLGQACVKLVFDVEDVSSFVREAEKTGLEFGPVHHADGYDFANTKDPAGNPISVSSRAFKIYG